MTANTPEQQEVFVDYEIYQEDELVASSNSLAHAEQYAEQYGQDGPVELRTSISIPGFHAVESALLSKLRAPVADERAANPHIGYPDLADAWQRGFDERTPGWSGLPRDIFDATYQEGKRARAALACAPVAGEARMPPGYRVKVIEGHGYRITPPTGGCWVAHSDTPAGDLISALLAAPQASEAVRDADHPVFAFLLGEGPLHGVHFGERAPGAVGKWWWRKYLRAALSAQPGAQKGCNCAKCRPHSVEMRMILCEVCGDKRCPHAADHRNECVGTGAQKKGGSDAE